MHVKCRNLPTASALYTAAMACGFRESGIGSNNLVGIRISLKLDAPLGYLVLASSFHTDDDTTTGRNGTEKDTGTGSSNGKNVVNKSGGTHAAGMRVRVLVSPAYLAELAIMTHSRFVENFRRRDQLHRKIETMFFVDGDRTKSVHFSRPDEPGTAVPTSKTEGEGKSSSLKEAEKAARREMKRREGLKRQAEKQAAAALAAAAEAGSQSQLQTEGDSGSHSESQTPSRPDVSTTHS